MPPELINVANIKKHIPYGRIDSELIYKITDEGKIKPEIKSLENLGYKLNERNFSDIKSIFRNSGDYQNLKFPYNHEGYNDNDGVYLGAEHCNQDSLREEILQKKCNLTFFGNLEAILDYNKKNIIVMGSSMGHTHPLNLNLQELYEFQNYGLMVIEKLRNGGKSSKETDMIFMEPKGKVAVPGNCRMTIYNLGLKPLETHDFANPRQNDSNKIYQQCNGPIFCIYYVPEDKQMFFDFNGKYLSSNNFPGRMQIPVKIKNENNLGEELFKKAKEGYFDNNHEYDFGTIKILTCQDTEIPGIDISQHLEKIVENKSQEFLSLFNIK